ncbi:MAG: cobalt ECF transporter T component CbiQ [Deltaproteobacteria bacterium]|nr:cobalt ECF transporter T component CbiQ [Deltaproteobacteria bacterium]
MTFETAYFGIGRLDRLSYQDTAVHRLDPRAKVIATMLFVVSVVSFPRYEVLSLFPFLLFPVLMSAIGDIPAGFIARKVVAISPFAVFVGMFNPLFDTSTVSIAPGLSVSAGWISFASILVKYALTISAALLLIATTSFPGICRGLRRLKVPSLFVSQLLFMYRYLFVLMEEAMRVVRARDMRSFGKRGTGGRIFIRIVGTLFLRTVERAERIYGAMLARGFRGEVPSMRHEILRIADVLFVLACGSLFALCRLVPLPEVIGRIAGGLFA